MKMTASVAVDCKRSPHGREKITLEQKRRKWFEKSQAAKFLLSPSTKDDMMRRNSTENGLWEDFQKISELLISCMYHTWFMILPRVKCFPRPENVAIFQVQPFNFLPFSTKMTCFSCSFCGRRMLRNTQPLARAQVTYGRKEKKRRRNPLSAWIPHLRMGRQCVKSLLLPSCVQESALQQLQLANKPFLQTTTFLTYSGHYDHGAALHVFVFIQYLNSFPRFLLLLHRKTQNPGFWKTRVFGNVIVNSIVCTL